MKHCKSQPFYSSLIARIYQWLGVVYGELSMEVREATERTNFQIQALDMLRKASQINITDHKLFYLLALQYSEMGDVKKF